MKDLVLCIARSVLAMFGFVTLVTGCRVEYGCPHAEFQLKGTVMDEHNVPINGIRVAVSAEEQNPYYQGAGPRDTVFTDSEGVYVLKNDYLYLYNHLHLKFEDMDGSENGGEFETVEMDVPVHQTATGDGNWDMGEFRSGADVTMKKK